MAKRIATTVLTKENCEDEDEPEDEGIFQQASAEDLKNRVLKKGKRRNLESSGKSPFLAFSGFSQTTTPSNFNFLVNVDTPSVTNGSTVPVAVEGDKDRSKKSTESDRDYYRQLKSLNECFHKWIEKHLSNSAYCDFTPVCKDYMRHLEELNKRFLPSAAERKAGSTETATSKFEISGQNSDSKSAQGFAFVAQVPESSVGSTSPRQGPVEAAKSFSFSATKARLSEASKQEVELVVVDNDEHTPPKNEFTPVEEQDSIYSIRCKLFFKKENDFVEKGIGTLHLKKLDQKTQLLIRADTNLGNVLLNISLKSLPIQRTGKNNVLIMCIPNPPIEKSSETEPVPIPMLIRVKTGQDADELFSKFKEHAI